ncbi:MAG: hypothetical protein D6773_09535, partial [Alphaproteobacteria bacterium]
TEEELYEGMIGVSVPVLDGKGQAMAALAMHGPLSRLTRDVAVARVPLLRETAGKLARAWGLMQAG